MYSLYLIDQATRHAARPPDTLTGDRSLGEKASTSCLLNGYGARATCHLLGGSVRVPFTDMIRFAPVLQGLPKAHTLPFSTFPAVLCRAWAFGCQCNTIPPTR